MGYIVLHSEKGTSGSGGIGNHIDRKEGQNHTFQHITPEQFSLNRNIKLVDDKHKMTLPQAINFRIEQGYNGNRKIRTDAVKFNTHILSGSHEDMKEIFKDKQKSDAWLKSNYDFVCKEFGKENIVRFTLHMDEKTPHIHAVTVPLTADGRLSSKEVLGNPKILRDRHDTYAQAMKPYGLERGKKGTGITHEDAKEYYTRMKEAIEPTEDLTAKNKVLGIEVGTNKDKTIENLRSALNSQKTLARSLATENKNLKEKYERVRNSADVAHNNVNTLLSNKNIYQREYEKRVESEKKDLKYEIEQKLKMNRELHLMDAKQKSNYLKETTTKAAEKNKISISMLTDIYTDKAFISNVSKEFDKNAEKLQERHDRGQDRGQNRSR